MTVNISKQLLGMACIVAGAFIPLILCTLNWLPYGFDPTDAAEFIHLTTPLLLTVMAITVLVNVRESSEARGLGETSLEQLPRNAATLLTGAVGMLLLFTYLPDRIPGHQFPQPDFIHRCSLRLRHDRHRSADGDRVTDNARKVPKIKPLNSASADTIYTSAVTGLYGWTSLGMLLTGIIGWILHLAGTYPGGQPREPHFDLPAGPWASHGIPLHGPDLKGWSRTAHLEARTRLPLHAVPETAQFCAINPGPP